MSENQCPKCKNPIDPGDDFCGTCGYRLSNNQEPKSSSDKEQKPPELKGVLNYVIYLVVIIASILLIFSGWYFIAIPVFLVFSFIFFRNNPQFSYLIPSVFGGFFFYLLTVTSASISSFINLDSSIVNLINASVLSYSLGISVLMAPVKESESEE